MKPRLIEFLKRAKDPTEQGWNTRAIKMPEESPQAPTAPGSPAGAPGTGPSKAALDSFAMDIDMPEEAMVSPLQGNPAKPPEPGDSGFGDTFREKLRRRRAQDSTPQRGSFTYG